MDQRQMEEFFKQVGFVPPEEDGEIPRASGPTAGSERPGPSGADILGGILGSLFGGANTKRKGRGASAGGAHAGGAGGSGADAGNAAADAGEAGESGKGPTGASDGSSGSGGNGGNAGGNGGGGKGNAPITVAGIPIPDWGKRAFIIFSIVLVIVLLFLYWWFHPPINIHSQDCWSFVTVFVLLPMLIIFTGMRRAYTTGTKNREADPKRANRFKKLSYIPIAIILLGLVGSIAGWSFWPGNAARYSSLLPIEESDFASDIQEVDYNSIPVIDRASSVLLGNRTLGEIPDYVSQFEISTLYSQINYQQKPVRVSPLNYADIFKWFYNYSTGIPAYVLVDMANQNAQVVRLQDPIYYSDSDPLFRNIDRHVQLHYPFYMFEEKSFEIDDEGTPWWVCPVQTRTIGLFGGETIKRVVLVNASTGECEDYPIEEVPQWVDRAYPSELLIRQYNWYGSLHNGWLNSWLGQQGVVQTTPGVSGNLGYNYIAKDDDVWVYTGVTSATADNAIVGFVLVNQRTAEAHYYSVAGATEDSAMSSAEGQVQNLRYRATFPLLLNINSQPTYFMALKDEAGLVKKFAMLDIQRYQNVAVGDTVSECQKSYKALLATNGVMGESDGSDLSEAAGPIRNMTQAVIDGNSHVYVTLDNDEHIFDCPLPGMIEIVGYGVGDWIELRYVESTPTSAVQEIVGSTSAATSASTQTEEDATAADAQDDSSTQSEGDVQESDVLSDVDSMEEVQSSSSSVVDEESAA